MSDLSAHPAWFELVTPDPASAARFYAGIAGWSVTEAPFAEHSGYHVADAPSGAGVAGIVAPTPGGSGPAGWTIYLGVADVDAVAARAVQLGGRVVTGPADIPHVGRYALLADPAGVAFAVMSFAGEAPTAFRADGGTDGDGHACWTELASPDPDGALAFYGALFGWVRMGGMAMGAMGDYAFVGPEGAAPFGAVMPSGTTGAPPAWSWYVQVPDIDAALATARGGGTVVQEPVPIHGGSFAANVLDPAGHPFGLVGKRADG